MIMPTKGEAPPTREEALAVLDDTARAVKAMKASWLRVALNLKRIRDLELWRFSPVRCSSFHEYVYGVLQINRTVARRMLEAMQYTEERRPDVLNDYLSGKDDVHVPSYDVLDQLRRARAAFEGREEDFEELETRVYEEGIGRVTLKRDIEEKLEEGAGGNDPPPPEPAAGKELPSLGGVIDELKALEAKLLKLEVSGEARRLMFRLVETLEKERRAAD